MTDKRARPRADGRDIIINGKVWRPRHRIAAENIGCSDRTLKRKNPKTATIAGWLYCPVEETLALLVADARRPNTNDTSKKSRRAGGGRIRDDA
jgi:hypothetical protein